MRIEVLNIIVTGAVAIIVPIATVYIKARFDRQDKKTVESDKKIEGYHKEVDGMKDMLVRTAHKLGAAENQVKTDREILEGPGLKKE